VIAKKRRGRARENRADHPIDDGTLPGNWAAQDVVLIYWQLDTNEGNATVGTNSVVYSYSAVQQAYGSITAFAYAVSTNSLQQLPTSNLAPNPDQYPQPWDFAIARSCYVVFVLQDPYHSWKFQPGQQAVTFKQNPDGWYSDLRHIKPDGSAGNVAGSGCAVCYFSARVDVSEDQGTDPFSIHFQFFQGPNPVVRDFDPAIKNKGHKTFYNHIATPFDVPAYSRTISQETRNLLTDNGRGQRNWI
jgi:hypothetical protein